jgi:hypothetical protein
MTERKGNPTRHSSTSQISKSGWHYILPPHQATQAYNVEVRSFKLEGSRWYLSGPVKTWCSASSLGAVAEGEQALAGFESADCPMLPQIAPCTHDVSDYPMSRTDASETFVMCALIAARLPSGGEGMGIKGDQYKRTL